MFVHAGQEAVIENAHIIINCLIKLVDYPHKTVSEFPCISYLLLKYADFSCVIKQLLFQLDIKPV